MSEPSKGPSGLPSARTRLLRAAADGELDASQRAALEVYLAQHPEDRAVVAFERRLREELGRACSTEVAPAYLEARLRSLAAQQDRPWWKRAGPLLAAAGLLLAAALAIQSALTDPEDFGFAGRADLVRFLATHPADCTISAERTLAEFRVQDFGGAASKLGSLLGATVDLGDLEGTDLRFLGMQRCGVPGEQTSMHLLFRGDEESALAGELLSIYVQPRDPRLPLDEGASYRLVPRTARFQELEVFAWRRGGLDYIVCTPKRAAAELVLASAAVPPVSGLL